MIAEPLIEVACAVCGGEGHDILCASRELRAHREYLRRFHHRRLKPDAPAGALADRAAFTHTEDADLVVCQTCGLLYRNPRPTAAAITRAYAGDQYGRQRLESLFRAQLELYQPKARFLERWLRPGARVVEVGSFVGGFLAAGQVHGWEVCGVDPGEEVGAFCSERGLPVVHGTLEDIRCEPGSVDAVAIWNTFDQLPDPQPTLEAVCRLLCPGGVLALRVPNGACFRWAVLGMRRLPLPLGGWLRAAMAWNNLLAFPYLHGYSVPTLDRLLIRHRFRRIAVHPDTLTRLSDEHTKRWAAWEERALKLLWRLVARVEALRGRCRLTLAPWFDAYYRKET
jgi:SAM-dependent methyltransferase